MASSRLTVLVLALLWALPRGRCFNLEASLGNLPLPPGPCRDHLRLFASELRNLTTWAITMFDATGKFPSGILRGNLRQLGDFDECLGLNIEDHFKGRYCIVDLHVTGIEHEVLDIMTAGRRNLELTHKQGGPAVLPIFSRIQWAVCVPSSCSADDVQKVVSHLFIPLKNIWNVKLEANVSPENCYMSSNVTLNYSDYFILGIILLVILLIISATILDQLSLRMCVEPNSETGNIRKVMDAFSVKKNWKLLWNVDSAGGAIACVDGIRALSTFWVVLTHKVLQLSQEPWVNKVLMLEVNHDFINVETCLQSM